MEYSSFTVLISRNGLMVRADNFTPFFWHLIFLSLSSRHLGCPGSLPGGVNWTSLPIRSGPSPIPPEELWFLLTLQSAVVLSCCLDLYCVSNNTTDWGPYKGVSFGWWFWFKVEVPHGVTAFLVEESQGGCKTSQGGWAMGAHACLCGPGLSHLLKPSGFDSGVSAMITVSHFLWLFRAPEVGLKLHHDFQRGQAMVPPWLWGVSCIPGLPFLPAITQSSPPCLGSQDQSPLPI